MLHCVPLQHTRIQQRKRKWSPTRRKSKLLEIGVDSTITVILRDCVGSLGFTSQLVAALAVTTVK